MLPSPDQREASGSFLRRPLVGLTLSALAGCILGTRLAAAPALLLELCALCLLWACLWRQRALCTWAIHAAVIFIFWAQAVLPLEAQSGLARLFSGRADHAFVSVVGIVDDDPEIVRRNDDGLAVWSFPLRVEGLQAIGDWRRSTFPLRVIWISAGADDPAFYGQRWLLHGLIRRDENARGKITFVMKAQPESARVLGEGHGNWLRGQCLLGRRACAEMLGRGVEDYPDEVGLLRALMLGYRQALPAHLYDIFSRTGTLHIVAISGSHIIIFSGIAIAFIRALGIPRTRWLYALAPLLILYTLGTGMAPSALRACAMAITYWSALLFKRKPDGPSALCLAALILLFVDPFQIRDPGFVLSFLAVAGLMAFYRPILNLLQKRDEPDPFALPASSPWLAVWRGLKRNLLSLVASSIAAWLVTTPLTALYFNQFSMVALVVNLFVIPLAAVILFTGCLSLLFGLFSQFAGEVFNHANEVFVSLMLHIIAWFDRIPLGHVFVRAPPVSALLFWYALLAALILGTRLARRLALVTMAVAGIAVITAWCRDDAVNIYVMGEGPTGVALVDAPGGDDVLVDTGSKVQSRAVLRWLRARGVDHLRALAITRLRSEVAGGAIEILGRVPVSELWLSDFGSRSPLFDKLLEAAQRAHVVVRRLSLGQAGALGGGVEWEALHPRPGSDYRNAAEAGLVIRFARGPSSLIYVGENHERIERELSSSPVEATASVVVFGTAPTAPESRLCRLNPLCLWAGEDSVFHIQFAGRRDWKSGEPEVVVTRAPDA